MKIVPLGHAGFRIEMAGQTILIDPWFTGNPAFEGHSKAEAIKGASHVLVSHGHGDHSGDALALAKEHGLTLVGIYDLMGYWAASEGISTIGFNKGGTIAIGDISVTMVNAVHSSSFDSDGGPRYAGAEAGFMISGAGRTIYFSGDTDVTADMGVFQALHAPDIGILSAGGHFTMDMKRAAYAAKTFFDFKVVIPCHYKTFDILEQSADTLIRALPGVEVIEPEVMVTIDLAIPS